MSVRYGTTEQRFWQHTNPEPNTGCWLWSGPQDENGYGRFRVGHQKVRAHRYSLAINSSQAVGPTDCVLHSCDNPACVNPDHLRIGTHADNAADRVARSRQARGEHLHAKLTEQDVISMRASKKSHRELAAEFGVSHRTVGAIKKRAKWKHLP